MFMNTFNYMSDFHLCLFTGVMITNVSFQPFVQHMNEKLTMNSGFLLNAGEFKGTSSAWGIIFYHWGPKSELGEQPIDVPIYIKESTVESGNTCINTLGTWIAHLHQPGTILIDKIYRTENNTLRNNIPRSPNGFTAPSLDRPRSSLSSKWIGYLQATASNVQKTGKEVLLLSMANYKGDGSSITKNNLPLACVVFSVRKACYEQISKERLLWVRDKDVFPAPTKEFQASDEWVPFMDDCLVYSLFASGSNQTSLRDYEYGVEVDGVTPKKWRINNEFYWESKEFIRELAIENKMPTIEKDLATDSERYVYSYLKPKRDEGELSDEAEALLSKATEILTASFKYRGAFYEEAPLYNTLSWDIGWLQVQRMCFGRDALSFAKADDELQALYAEFKALRSALGEKIAARYSEDTGF